MNSPIIYMTYETKRKLDYYILLTNTEISGWGIVVPYKEGLLIQDVFIVTQECTAAESDMSQEAISDMLLGMVLDTMDISLVKLFWHSHAKMKTFWSKTDDDTIRMLSKDSWLLSIVGSHTDEYLARLDIDKPVHVTLDNLSIQVTTPYDEELKEAIQNEIARKVTVKKYVVKENKHGKQPNILPTAIGYSFTE